MRSPRRQFASCMSAALLPAMPSIAAAQLFSARFLYHLLADGLRTPQARSGPRVTISRYRLPRKHARKALNRREMLWQSSLQ